MGDDRPLTSQSDLEAITIGPVVRLDGPLRIADPDPAWPALYAREASRIRAALGESVLLLEHVGSTSIAGMPAKPIVDIVLVVEDSSDEAAYLPSLEAAGYELRIREPEWHAHRLFKGPDTAIDLHVFPSACSEPRRMVAFRDRLRTHPVDFDRYLAAKRRLAARRWEFVQQYAGAKSAVVEAILADAAGPERSSGGVADC